MSKARDKIRHVFVLMMENRSFDHMLGFAPGLAVDGADRRVSRIGATDRLAEDLPHELEQVTEQLKGVEGFRRTSGELAFDCFHPDCLPVLGTLAREYAVCDQWFSSMPGPTWPNRFFAHAGSSGGLDNSPGSLASIGAITIDRLGFDFQNGHIFDRLPDDAWRVYYGEAFPQVLALKGVHKPFLRESANFRKLHRLRQHLQDPGFEPQYVFIEPDYGILGLHPDFRHGNSQHPIGSVAAGERLIRDVYEALIESPLWNSSMLVVCYDEHGGFYDHCVPQKAIVPGDADLNRGRAEHPGRFAFDRYGFRVPAVVVSPWIPRGRPSHELYDHTTILRTLDHLWGLGSFTNRDRAANGLDGLLTLREPRTDRPQIPDAVACGHQGVLGQRIPPYVTTAEVLEMEARGERGPAKLVADDGAPDGVLTGYTRIAATVELAMAKEAPDLFSSEHIPAKPMNAGQARAYVYEVARKLEGFRNKPEPAPLEAV